MIQLPRLEFPPPNPCVLARLAASARRAPAEVHGRRLFLQRLGLVVLPHEHLAAGPGRRAGWVCTVADGALDARSLVGAFVVDDVEAAAALEVRDVDHPAAELTPTEFGETWMVQVWGCWPGGPAVQTAQAVLDLADPTCSTEGPVLTVATAAAWQRELARRAGLPLGRAVARQCSALAQARLLVPHRGASGGRPGTGAPLTRPEPPADRDRRYRLQLRRASVVTP